MRLIIELVALSYLFLIDSSCAGDQINGSTTLTDLKETNNEYQKQQCNTEQIEYRLTKLEILDAERSEHIKSELRENSQQLQILVWQTGKVSRTVEELTDEIGQFTGSNLNAPSTINSKDGNVEPEMAQKLESLSRAVHVAIAAIKMNNAEIKSIKNHIEVIGNNSRTMMTDYEQLLNKEFFNDAVVDMKRRISVRHSLKNDCASTTNNKPQDCVDLHKLGKKSGIYKIYSDDHPQGFMVLCDMDTNGGGWTVIHNRYDGSQNFYGNWHEYKHGFGNLGGEFWLGLDYIHYLTGDEINELMIEVADHTSTRKFAHYGAFSIGSEVEGYSLKLLSNYQGDAGDSLTYQAGSRFSTKDMDQDSWEEGSCAKSHGGAWWYKACDTSNLNGRYLNGELPETLIYQGMYWGEFRGAQYSLKQARMMIRPRDKVAIRESDELSPPH